MAETPNEKRIAADVEAIRYALALSDRDTDAHRAAKIGVNNLAGYGVDMPALRADAELVAALRAALAEVVPGERLEFYRAAMGEDRILVSHSMLYEPDSETDATRLLAALLTRASSQETKT